MKVRSVSWVLAAALLCVASQHGVLGAPAEVDAAQTEEMTKAEPAPSIAAVESDVKEAVKEVSTEDMPAEATDVPAMLMASSMSESPDLLTAIMGRKRRSPTYKKYGGGGGGYYPQQGGCNVCNGGGGGGYPHGGYGQGGYGQGGSGSYSQSSSQSSSSSWGGGAGKK